jgi:hypothetical protein
MDKTQVNGGTLSWSVTCATPKITVHQEWIVHYHGETMDGQVTSRSTTPDHTPVESTTQLRVATSACAPSDVSGTHDIELIGDGCHIEDSVHNVAPFPS